MLLPFRRTELLVISVEANSLLGQLVDVRKMLCGLIRKLDTAKQKTTTPVSPAT
jgi:hypothetical protein